MPGQRHTAVQRRMRLRWPVHTCDICDTWLNINPGIMLSLFLKHLQLLLCTCYFYVWIHLETLFGWHLKFCLPGTELSLYGICPRQQVFFSFVNYISSIEHKQHAVCAGNIAISDFVFKIEQTIF